MARVLGRSNVGAPWPRRGRAPANGASCRPGPASAGKKAGSGGPRLTNQGGPPALQKRAGWGARSSEKERVGAPALQKKSGLGCPLFRNNTDGLLDVFELHETLAR